MEVNWGIYVAEIGIPAEIHLRRNFSAPLPSGQYFGFRRGYWKMLTQQDYLGTDRSKGLLVIVEFPASGLEDAEDKAFELGEKLCQLAAFYGGSPGHAPLLKRLGRVGPNEGLLEQSEYFYLDERDRLRQIEMKPHEFQKLLEGLGDLPDESRQAVELAARWYVMSVSSENSMDGYLAAWIGFEAIGTMLSDIYHPNGPRAPCSLCGNTAGIVRNRKIAGIGHMIRRTAPEILDGRTIKDLSDIRNNIAHCLKPVDQLRGLTDDLLRDLQLSLSIGILTGANRSGEHRRIFSSFLPREYAVRPDARATIIFEEEWVRYQPYFGQWLELGREFPNERSRMEENGAYVWGANTRISWKMQDPAPVYDSKYVMFGRDGMNLQDIGAEGPAVPVIRWRDRPIPLSWQRVEGEATGESEAC